MAFALVSAAYNEDFTMMDMAALTDYGFLGLSDEDKRELFQVYADMINHYGINEIVLSRHQYANKLDDLMDTFRVKTNHKSAAYLYEKGLRIGRRRQPKLCSACEEYLDQLVVFDFGQPYAQLRDSTILAWDDASSCEAEEFRKFKKCLLSKIHGHRYSDRTKLLPTGDITVETAMRLVEKQGQNCFICGDFMLVSNFDAYCYYQFTLDRIDNSHPHNTDNCFVTCYYCNCREWWVKNNGDTDKKKVCACCAHTTKPRRLPRRSYIMSLYMRDGKFSTDLSAIYNLCSGVDHADRDVCNKSYSRYRERFTSPRVSMPIVRCIFNDSPDTYLANIYGASCEQCKLQLARKLWVERSRLAVMQHEMSAILNSFKKIMGELVVVTAERDKLIDAQHRMIVKRCNKELYYTALPKIYNTAPPNEPLDGATPSVSLDQ